MKPVHVFTVIFFEFDELFITSFYRKFETDASLKVETFENYFE